MPQHWWIIQKNHDILTIVCRKSVKIIFPLRCSRFIFLDETAVPQKLGKPLPSRIETFLLQTEYSYKQLKQLAQLNTNHSTDGCHTTHAKKCNSMKITQLKNTISADLIRRHTRIPWFFWYQLLLLTNLPILCKADLISSNFGLVFLGPFCVGVTFSRQTFMISGCCTDNADVLVST